MEDAINEFMFKRKRKRQRTLDALQGLGMEAFVSLDQTSDTQLDAGLIPGIAVLAEPVTSSALPDNQEPPSPKGSSENIVTVERFLRSVQTVPRAKQAVPGVVTLRKHRAYTHHRQAERRARYVQKVTKMSKPPREPSRIARTLFRAAVLTDGDPRDTLMTDAGISHVRRPLKFVPFHKFATPFGPGEPNSASHDLGRGRNPAPYTRVTQRNGNTPGLERCHHISHQRVPLYLVPFREAEASYSLMFP